MGRKSIDVATLIEWFNVRLATPSSSMAFASAEEERQYRRTVASMAEQVLHGTGNYGGFNYQESELLPTPDGAFGGPLKPDYDDTRRVYYVRSY